MPAETPLPGPTPDSAMRSPDGSASSGARPVASPPPAASTPRRQQGADDAQDDPGDELRSFVTDEPPRSRLNVAGWVGSAVTVALLGAAAFYGASAAGKEGDVNRLLGYRDNQTGMPAEYATVAATFEEDMRIGRRDNQIAKGLALAAGATAVASAVVFIIDGLRGRTDQPSSQLAISLLQQERGTASLGLVWSLRR